MHYFRERFGGIFGRARRLGFLPWPRRRLWNFAAEIALDHRERAAGQVAEAVGEIAVVSRNQRIVGKAAVLPENDLAQQVIPQRLDANRADYGARPYYVAARLAHFF